MPFYAVAVGKVPGVYNTWDDAKEQVSNWPKAKHKKFGTKEEADAYVAGKDTTQTIEAHEPPPILQANTSDHPPLVAFTDGSCLKNNEPDHTSNKRHAAYAVVWPENEHYNSVHSIPDGEPKTNNRAELLALVQAFKTANDMDPTKHRALVVYSDSRLMVDSINKWLPSWCTNNWLKKDRKPVNNADLFKIVHACMQERNLTIHHIPAHTGRNDWHSIWNTRVDLLAIEMTTRLNNERGP